VTAGLTQTATATQISRHSPHTVTQALSLSLSGSLSLSPSHTITVTGRRGILGQGLRGGGVRVGRPFGARRFSKGLGPVTFKINNRNTHRGTGTVCFFVLCIRHWFNRVMGTNLGSACLPVHPYSDAGCADLPLTLLGAPVSIGVALTVTHSLSVCVECLFSMSPGQSPTRAQNLSLPRRPIPRLFSRLASAEPQLSLSVCLLSLSVFP
jgi:hypothetical protein